jgi:hypothetical protein
MSSTTPPENGLSTALAAYGAPVSFRAPESRGFMTKENVFAGAEAGGGNLVESAVSTRPT